MMTIMDELEFDLVPGGAGELVELAFGREDDKADLGVAEDGELVGLFEQAAPPLREAHLPARLVLDPPQLDSSPPHGLLLSVLDSSPAFHPIREGRKKESRRENKP